MRRWVALAALLLTALVEASASRVTRQDIDAHHRPEFAGPPALLAYINGLAQRLQPDDPPEIIGDALNVQARALILNRRADLALPLTIAAEALASATGDRVRAASARLQQGVSRYFQGDDARGIPLAKEGFQAQRALRNPTTNRHPDPTRLFIETLDYATVLFYTDDLAELVALIRPLEQALPDLAPRDSLAISLGMLRADILLDLRDHDAVVDEVTRTINLARTSGRTALLPDLLIQLANVQMIRSDWTAARRAIEDAQASLAGLDDAAAEAGVRLAESKLAYHIGEVRRSAELATKALAVFDRLDDPNERAHVLAVRARAHARAGQITEARRDLAQARALATSIEGALEQALLEAEVHMALASGNVPAASASLDRERAHRRLYERQSDRRRLAALRAWHSVAENELRLTVLERESSIRQLESQRARATLRLQTLAIAVAVLLLLLATLGALYYRRRARRFRELSDTDALTRTLSRAAILADLDRRIAERGRSARRTDPLTIMLIDLDHFKSFNDRLGHLVGDRILRHAVDTIRSTLRAEDRIGRIGGDEFLVILPGTDWITATHVAERIQRSLATARPAVELPGESEIRTSVSIGIAEWDASCVDASALIEKADRFLLEAKQAGRGAWRPVRPAESASLGGD